MLAVLAELPCSLPWMSKIPVLAIAVTLASRVVNIR
jgi:hypothetical protein